MKDYTFLPLYFFIENEGGDSSQRREDNREKERQRERMRDLRREQKSETRQEERREKNRDFLKKSERMENH